MALDLVCHMEVDENQPDTLSVLYKGVAYYFCTELCRVQFLANPEKYIEEYREGKNRKTHKGLGNKQNS